LGRHSGDSSEQHTQHPLPTPFLKKLKRCSRGGTRHRQRAQPDGLTNRHRQPAHHQRHHQQSTAKAQHSAGKTCHATHRGQPGQRQRLIIRSFSVTAITANGERQHHVKQGLQRQEMPAGHQASQLAEHPSGQEGRQADGKSGLELQ